MRSPPVILVALGCLSAATASTTPVTKAISRILRADLVVVDLRRPGTVPAKIGSHLAPKIGHWERGSRGTGRV